jgi:hypothetical protein
MKIFAIDLERSGQYGKFNFTTQVGICCLDTDKFSESLLFKPSFDKENDKDYSQLENIPYFSTYLPQPENTEWEPRCVKEFWEKNPELFEKTKNSVKNAGTDGVERMLEWIERNKDPNPANNLLITDNAAFDFVFFSELIAPYKRSLLYLFGEYETQPLDVGCYYLGLLKRNIITGGTWNKNSVFDGCPNFVKLLNLTPHDAGHDAINIGLKFIFVTKKFAN